MRATGSGLVAAVGATRRLAWPSLRRSWSPWSYVYLLPAFGFLGVFSYYPIAWMTHGSLHQWNLASPRQRFVGLANFTAFWTDELFWKVLRNNAIFLVGTIPVTLALLLVFALAVRRGSLRSGVLRTVFFYPTMLPLIGAAGIWLFIFTPTYGLLGHHLGFLGVRDTNWLGSPDLALPSLMVLTVWKYAGYYMLFYLAGLQGIPQDLYEAGRLEGASAWSEFRYITWPLLTPTTLFTVVIAVISAFQAVDHVWLMTNGGPNNATNLLLYFIYQNGFAWWDLGKASALSVVLMAILLSLALASFRLIERRVQYGG